MACCWQGKSIFCPTNKTPETHFDKTYLICPILQFTGLMMHLSERKKMCSRLRQLTLVLWKNWCENFNHCFFTVYKNNVQCTFQSSKMMQAAVVLSFDCGHCNCVLVQDALLQVCYFSAPGCHVHCTSSTGTCTVELTVVTLQRLD